MGLYNLKQKAASVLDMQGAASMALGPGSGNVYFVVQEANSNVYEFCLANLDEDYADGSTSIHTTIQSALNATVANRNDYVIVMPDSSDYDITAALTMSKKCVHLICPAGLGSGGFPTNAARIHQNTTATALFTVTGQCVEIAGFFFKGYAGANIITLSGTIWTTVIHDNFFGISATASSNNYGVVGTGACGHVSIYDNYFTNYVPGAVSGTNNDVAAFIGMTSLSSTRNLIRNNIFVTGPNSTIAAGIQYSGSGGVIIENYLWESAALSGIADAGIFTVGISTAADSLVANNCIGIATAGNGVNGATADQSYVANYEGTSGGTLLT